MLKLAVIGAQTLMGRELVTLLEAQEASVLPLSSGPLTQAEEEGDLVVFAPDPALLEGLDLVILVDTPAVTTLLADFPRRVLDLRETPDMTSEPWPLVGAWPQGHRVLRKRSAVEQILALLPSIAHGFGDVSGTHLRSVACLGMDGLEGLRAQSLEILEGKEPDLQRLGYRAAFEVVPQEARGCLIEIRVPVFHGDLLVLHMRAEEGERIHAAGSSANLVVWQNHPPTSREVAVSADLIAQLSTSADGSSAVLTLGFDPILWGTLRPILRLLNL